MRKLITEEESFNIFLDFKRGMSVVELTDKYKRSDNAIRSHIKRHGGNLRGAIKKKSTSDAKKKKKEKPKESYLLICQSCEFARAGIKGRMYCTKTKKYYTTLQACPLYKKLKAINWLGIPEEYLLHHPFWEVEYTAQEVYDLYFENNENEKFKKFLYKRIVKGWVKDNPYIFINLMNQALVEWRNRKE